MISQCQASCFSIEIGLLLIETDMNEPSNLEFYRQVIELENDPSRPEIRFYNPDYSQQRALQAIAHSRKLEFEYHLGTARVFRKPSYATSSSSTDIPHTISSLFALEPKNNFGYEPAMGADVWPRCVPSRPLVGHVSSSTCLSESPGPVLYSRDTTPISMSSISLGFIAPLKAPNRLRQGSPVMNRPPVTRRRAGSNVNDYEPLALEPQGLPSLRESLTSSSSSSTVKCDSKTKEKKRKRLSPLPPSPPPRKASQGFKKALMEEQDIPSKLLQQPSKLVLTLPFDSSHVNLPISSHIHQNSNHPPRSSKNGTPDQPSQLGHGEAGFPYMPEEYEGFQAWGSPTILTADGSVHPQESSNVFPDDLLDLNSDCRDPHLQLTDYAMLGSNSTSSLQPADTISSWPYPNGDGTLHQAESSGSQFQPQTDPTLGMDMGRFLLERSYDMSRPPSNSSFQVSSTGEPLQMPSYEDFSAMLEEAPSFSGRQSFSSDCRPPMLSSHGSFHAFQPASRSSSVSSLHSDRGRSRISKLFKRSSNGSMYSPGIGENVFSSRSSSRASSGVGRTGPLGYIARAGMKAVRAVGGACWRCKILGKKVNV
jgi:hypothetical protein